MPSMCLRFKQMLIAMNVAGQNMYIGPPLLYRHYSHSMVLGGFELMS